ncbi:MAG: hypothetical protein ACRD2I_16570 [Vicinamibacterales bacterium]
MRALQGGRQLSRPRLYALLEGAGITTDRNRGLHILWRCAHDGLICFAARDGKRHTFALLAELSRDAVTIALKPFAKLSGANAQCRFSGLTTGSRSEMSFLRIVSLWPLSPACPCPLLPV